MNNWSVSRRTDRRTLIFRTGTTLLMLLIICGGFIAAAFGFVVSRRRGYRGSSSSDSNLQGLVHWVFDNLSWLIPLVLLAGVVITMWGWLGFKFHLEDDALKTQDGLLLKGRKSTRYDRIQSVKLSEPFQAKLFGLSKLEIEVAGEDSEIEIEYLPRDEAYALRDELQRRSQLGVRAPGL